MKYIQNLWQYREFIRASVKREFQIKYQNSLLGGLWNVLNPLSMIFIYTVIFSQVMKARLPESDAFYGYSTYLCSGVITWALFAEIVGRGQTIFLDNANMLKKISFPRIVLPMILVANAGLNFIIIFSLFIGFILITGQFPGWAIMAVIPVLLIQVLFSIGLGLSLGVLNVFFRDVGQFFNIFLQFWFWLTPIVYPMNVLPEKIKPLIMTVNPMAPIIGAYQTIFVKAQAPNWDTLTSPLILSLILCIIAIRLFVKHSHEMVDEL